MRSILSAINFIAATILTALFFVSIAAGQLRGVGPGMTVAPHTLTFPPQMVGTRSAAKTITVTNITSQPLRISVSTSAPFQSVGCAGASLGPQGSCTINVTFAPVVVGPKNGETAVYASNALIRQSVTLSGTGVALTTTSK